MPVIRISPARLLKLIGRDITIDELSEILFRLKCEVEIGEDGKLVIEVNNDRPDMMISEGIARNIRGLLGIELGYKRPIVRESNINALVHEVPSRPYIAVAVVRNVDIDEEFLEELIQFQEKLHITYGRNRRKVAIGLHDLSKLPCREINYALVPLSKKFIPLHHYEEMSVKEVLEKTEQGQKYGSISIYKDMHPAVMACDEIIAIPPVINADITRIEPGTKDLFIDVTGTDYDAILRVLDVIVTNLAERGGIIERIRVEGKNNRIITPELREETMEIEISYINNLLGTSLTLDEVIKHLEAMRFEALGKGKNLVKVIIPPYRIDILHPADIVEEVAISIGYDNLGPQPIPNYLPAKRSRKMILVKHLRELFVGLGFQEVMTLVLMSRDFVKKIFRGEIEVLEVLNPLSLELSCVRTSLLPGIIAILEKSQYAEMPVKVFEVGYVVTKDENSPTGWRNELRLAVGVMDSEISFEDIQAPIYAVLRALGLQPQTRTYRHPTLINGRTAELLINEEHVGYLGEVHPEVLETLGIKYPVAVAELNVDKIKMILK